MLTLVWHVLVCSSVRNQPWGHSFTGGPSMSTIWQTSLLQAGEQWGYIAFYIWLHWYALKSALFLYHCNPLLCVKIWQLQYSWQPRQALHHTSSQTEISSFVCHMDRKHAAWCMGPLYMQFYLLSCLVLVVCWVLPEWLLPKPQNKCTD